MPCTTDYVRLWLDGKFVDAVRCPFQNVAGDGFALIAILAVGVSFMILSDGKPSLTLTLLFIVGSVTVTLLPAQVVTAVGIGAVIIVLIAVWMLVRQLKGGPA